MKEITKTILLALANVDSGEINRLPIDPEIYGTGSLQIAAEAFRPYCTMIEHPASTEISIQVHPEHRLESRHVLGAFLNFLLCDTVSRSISKVA
jgi:hypothetical protein